MFGKKHNSTWLANPQRRWNIGESVPTGSGMCQGTAINLGKVSFTMKTLIIQWLLNGQTEMNANVNSALIGCFCSFGQKFEFPVLKLWLEILSVTKKQKKNHNFVAWKLQRQLRNFSICVAPASALFVYFTQLWLICLVVDNKQQSDPASSPLRAPSALPGKKNSFVTIPWSWLQQTVGGKKRRMRRRRDAD